MNKLTTKIAAGIAILALGTVALTGCYNNDEYLERKDKQSEALNSSLGIDNQKERLKREEDPNAIRYVYLLTFNGDVLGYYTIKGKVSASGTQLAPEQEVIRYYGEPNILDSAKDDGTYGADENGSFFFTTEGVLIEIDGPWYIQSDAPIQLYSDAPQLNK